MIKLSFRRDLQQLREFEHEALRSVTGLGWFYPLNLLDRARVESEIARPGIAPSSDTLTVFFRLVNFQGSETIEVVEQPFSRVFDSAGFIVAGSEGANLTIEDKVVNGHFALLSIIERQSVEFVYQFGGEYAASEGSVRNPDAKRRAA